MSETKRYTKQEIIDLVAATETILKVRQAKQEALPWTYSDLKCENKDLEFDLIQKKIKNALGCSATEYFTKHGYVYDPEKGYTEQQLNKLLYEFRNRKFKTMEAFIKATKKPECFYDIESAITFVESAYHTGAVDYFMEKGILEPIAKQLALGGKTIYSFTEYSLPEREKIEGFVTKRVRTEDGAFRVYGEWASCLFKGFREDIEAMQQRYASISYMQVDNTDVDGIAVARCCENNDVPYIVDAIAEFPQLKFLAFYKDYENSSRVYTLYSESGYPFITDSTFVGHFDYKSENPWVNEHTPDETFKYSELYIAVGETMSGNYKCPYTKEWNSLNYVVFENNITKIMTNNTDTTKRIESKKDMLKQARYPVTIDFDVYHGKCPHKVGEILYLKKKGNEILLLDAKGKTLCSYCWGYMQFDAWECEPFKLSPQNHIKILGNELEELTARVSAIEDMTKNLDFHRVYVEISLKD